MKKNNLKISCELKEVMKNKNISIDELSKLTGLSYITIKRWYKGNLKKINTDELIKICYILNCKVEDLFKIVTEKTPKK